MGEYAEMEIFAQMRGKDSCDLSIGELSEFYKEYDRPKKLPKGHWVVACGCGKHFKNAKARDQHKRDTGHD